MHIKKGTTLCCFAKHKHVTQQFLEGGDFPVNTGIPSTPIGLFDTISQ